MINARMSYLRPGNLFHEFVIESGSQQIGSFGRPGRKYDGETRNTLKGALADATTADKERWSQLQHPITHTIVQAGAPKAKAEDKLVLGDRIFLIHAVDDCGGAGITTIYYAEERMDVQ